MSSQREQFIRQVLSAGFHPPETMTLMVTGVCNLYCRHCLLNCDKSEGTVQLVCADILRVIDQFTQLGGSRINLTGGEILSHPDWQKILQFCVDHTGIDAVCLQTNATLICREHIEALLGMKRDILTIQVSLDGACARAHDIVRGSGSHARAMAGLRLLVDAGMGEQTQVAFTEMVHNYDELPQLLEDVDQMGLGRLISSTLVKSGRATFSTCIGPPTPAQYVKLIDRYRSDADFKKRYDRKATIAAIEWYKNRSASTDSRCGCLKNIFINADGHLYPCPMLLLERYAMHGLYTAPLERMILEALAKWREIPILSSKRPHTILSCARCAYKSHCGGGCMGRAAMACGELTAPEDRCALRQAVYNCDEQPDKEQSCRSCKDSHQADFGMTLGRKVEHHDKSDFSR